MALESGSADSVERQVDWRICRAHWDEKWKISEDGPSEQDLEYLDTLTLWFDGDQCLLGLHEATVYSQPVYGDDRSCAMRIAILTRTGLLKHNTMK